MIEAPDGISTAKVAPPPPPPPPKHDAHAFNTAVSQAKSSPPPTGSPANLNQLADGLHGEGDQFTVSMQVGARAGMPTTEIGIPGVAGPQAQYGYDVTVKQSGNGANAQYQVTFDKDLMAGANLEIQTPGWQYNAPDGSSTAGVTAGFEANLMTAGTVTMTFSSKQDLKHGLDALSKEAQAQTLRDAGSLVDPKVAIAKPSISHQDASNLSHDGHSLLSDLGHTALSGLKAASDALVPGRQGNLPSDVGSFAGNVGHTAGDGAKTAVNLGQTAWHTASGEVRNTLGDNADTLGNFIRNPLDQWPNGSPSISVPLNAQGGGPLISGELDGAAAKVGPSAQELQFLKSHITGYSITIGAQGRARLEAGIGVNADIGPVQTIAKAVGQPRLADNSQITIAETLPQNGKPGSVSVTFANKLNLDARGVAEFKAGLNGFQGLGNQIADPNVASATGSVTLSWNLSAAQSKKLADAGHSLPITDLVSGHQFAHPDTLTTKLDVQGAAPVVQQNGKWVYSGTLSHETLADWSTSTTYKDPRVALKVLSGANSDPFGVIPTLSSSGHSSQTQLDLYDQHGLPMQNDLGGRINDVGEAKVWLYRQAVSDNLIRPPTALPPTQPKQPAPPQTQQLVVLPYEGLDLRTAPGVQASKLGAFSSGTFVQTTGKTGTDVQGNQWVQVTGPISDRQTMTGWVEAQYVMPHARGGENATGRVDQTLRGRGYTPVTVHPGDTIDGIATRYGKDPAQAVVVNDGHIIDPNLIFPGDAVYLPSEEMANQAN